MLFYPIRIFFTFHNVSINTICLSNYPLLSDYFTFHNVSINTRYHRGNPEQTQLYIPQCFY